MKLNLLFIFFSLCFFGFAQQTKSDWYDLANNKRLIRSRGFEKIRGGCDYNVAIKDTLIEGKQCRLLLILSDSTFSCLPEPYLLEKKGNSYTLSEQLVRFENTSHIFVLPPGTKWIALRFRSYKIVRVS